MTISYVKLPRGCLDFGVGFQSVNQLRDNFSAIATAFDAEHSTLETVPGRQGGTIPPPLGQSFGRHRTPKVPRAVVLTALFSSSFTITLPGAVLIQPVVTGIARVSTGVFFIGITELTEFYAETEATQTSAATQRLVLARSIIGGFGAPFGISVECYEKSGTDWAPTDFDFVAHIYGTI